MRNKRLDTSRDTRNKRGGTARAWPLLLGGAVTLLLPLAVWLNSDGTWKWAEPRLLAALLLMCGLLRLAGLMAEHKTSVEGNARGDAAGNAEGNVGRGMAAAGAANVDGTAHGKSGLAGAGWLIGMLVLAVLGLWSNALLPLKLYPVLINGVMLGVFGASLIFPPSAVERLARLREPDFPDHAIAYTRRVTQVWCVFFVLNGAIALTTALWASPAVWSLYNGVIAYVLMGLLFAGEFLVRLRHRRRHLV